MNNPAEIWHIHYITEKNSELYCIFVFKVSFKMLNMYIAFWSISWPE